MLNWSRIGAADDRTFPGLHRHRPRIVRHRPRDLGQRRVGTGAQEFAPPCPRSAARHRRNRRIPPASPRACRRRCASTRSSSERSSTSPAACAIGTSGLRLGVVQPDRAHIEPHAAQFGRMRGPGAAADAVRRLQHQCAATRLAQGGRRAEPGQAGADHDHIDIGRGGRHAAGLLAVRGKQRRRFASGGQAGYPGRRKEASHARSHPDRRRHPGHRHGAPVRRRTPGARRGGTRKGRRHRAGDRRRDWANSASSARPRRRNGTAPRSIR